MDYFWLQGQIGIDVKQKGISKGCNGCCISRLSSTSPGLVDDRLCEAQFSIDFFRHVFCIETAQSSDNVCGGTQETIQLLNATMNIKNESKEDLNHKVPQIVLAL